MLKSVLLAVSQAKEENGTLSLFIAHGLVLFFLREIPPAPPKPSHISEEDELGFLHWL